MTGTPTRPAILMIVAGSQTYREEDLRAVAHYFDVALLSPWTPSWERAYVVDFEELRPGDVDQCLNAARRLSRRRPCDGVFTWYEPCVELVATVAADLGLPHTPLEAVRSCRDKLLMRERLRGSPYSVRRFEPVDDRLALGPATQRVGYPCIVKPRALSASFGVTRVDGEAGVSKCWDALTQNDLTEPWPRADGYLVEEFVSGQEISVDCAVVNGVATPLIWALKNVAVGNTFEETRHVVVPEDHFGGDSTRIRLVLDAVHETLGLNRLVTHTELMVVEDRITVVEVNGRGGGDLLATLGRRATGLDAALVAAQVACGLPAETVPARHSTTGIEFLYAGPDQQHLADDLRAITVQHPSIFGAHVFVADETAKTSPAELARRYMSRVGYIAVESVSAKQCADELDAIKLDLARIRR